MKSFFIPAFLIGAGLFAASSNVALAQTNIISIIVPQPAGNPTDGVARKLQPLLQKELGQTVVVENIPGAGGSIGVQKVLSGPADGSQIVIVSQTEPILTPFTLKGVKYKLKNYVDNVELGEVTGATDPKQIEKPVTFKKFLLVEATPIQ